MKLYYVYEIVNLMGTVEHVGLTIRPKIRFYEHTGKPNNNVGHGKFYKRQDVSMHIVSIHNTRKEGRFQEDRLQEFWGFEAESRKRARIGKETFKPLRGEDNKASKLTDACVIEIKNLLTKGFTGVEIAKKYNISKATVSLIKQNKVWTHIKI